MLLKDTFNVLKCSYLAAQSRSIGAKAEKKGLGLSILHDSDNENRISRLPEGRGNEWKEAPTESVMSKENVNMPGKWTGENVSSRLQAVKLVNTFHHKP